MQTNVTKKADEQKQMIALVLLGLAILIGFFLTKEQYYSYIEKSDSLSTVTKAAEEKKASHVKLQNLVKEITENASLQSDIERYAGDFREDQIIDSLFTRINGVSIASISMSPGEKAPNGLSLANISLAFRADDLTSLTNFLEYLTTSKANKKSYIVKNISFPLDQSKNEPISSSVELGMYYFK